MPSAPAASRADSAEREAIARISHHLLFCMPGMTLCRPIFAVLRMPQTTLFIFSSRWDVSGRVYLTAVDIVPGALLPRGGAKSAESLHNDPHNGGLRVGMKRAILLFVSALWVLPGLGASPEELLSAYAAQAGQADLGFAGF